MAIHHLSAKELHDILEQKNPDSILVDVRTNEEFKRGTIEGAVNFPVDKLAMYVDKLNDYKNVYLFCLSGSRSEFAMMQLQSFGVKGEIFHLTSGLLAWRKEGYTVA